MSTVTKPVERVGRVGIRFAGDSGDGMQLTGDRFTAETASLGNDLATLPNFPAEIRAHVAVAGHRVPVRGNHRERAEQPQQVRDAYHAAH